MTRDEFDAICRDICPHCKADAPLRQRDDTKEMVHDVTTEIPGTLGKRVGHAFCLASHFRNKWEAKLSE